MTPKERPSPSGQAGDARVDEYPVAVRQKNPGRDFPAGIESTNVPDILKLPADFKQIAPKL
jgi:hypothetical protein